ncbi:hypothetical protein [Marivirga sp.]|uniref:hypothetical protein n=1 Tax=Marivirga sp. TaxID=2018662 RepID=UPI002D7E9715|nr:hypothetical protein [Marivirga sp.]HET8860310.1 hypothetical protein [Marivirga sp.]
MRKIIKKFTLLMLLPFVLLACNEEKIQNDSFLEENADINIPSDMGGINFKGVILPNGTKSEVSNDGSTLTVKLPEGVFYIASLNGELISSKEGGYTCTSTCSGGCDVVKLGSEVGCSRCPEGSTEECVGKDPDDEGFYSIGEGTGGGFINKNIGISFVKSGEDRIEHFQSPDWEVLMQYPDFERAFNSFVKDLWPEGKVDRENADLVVVNAFGTYLRMYVPSSFLSSRTDNELISGGDVSCDCSSGESGCVYEEITTGPFNTKIGDKCVAGACESCTMSF